MAGIMTVSKVREIYPRPEGAAVQERWRKLDRFMRAFIKRSPFLYLGTTNAAGKADVSPAATRPALRKSLTTRPAHSRSTGQQPPRLDREHYRQPECRPHLLRPRFRGNLARERQGARRRRPEPPRLRRLHARVYVPSPPRSGSGQSLRRAPADSRKVSAQMNLADQDDRRNVGEVGDVVCFSAPCARSARVALSISSNRSSADNR